MTQTRLYITTGKARAKAVYDALDAICEDEGWPLAFFEVDEERDIHEVSLYVEDDPAEVEGKLRAAAGDRLKGLTIEREVMPDIDWVSKSLEGLKPVRAGRFLVHGRHDRDKRRIGDIAIEIEAGQAFGTGHHGTTAGCLTVIGEVVRREHPRNALDLGTGSAVLAIAIARLARIPVLATDIDPVATRVAAENVALNGTSAYVVCETATGFHHRAFALGRPFDLIVANILARPLMKLAPDMARHLTPGGSVILSGILVRQRNAVVAAFVGQGFRHVRTLTVGDWVTIHMKR